MTALPRTDDLFRDDATLHACAATVLAADANGVVLDRTVFYPLGGGQAGDAGVLVTADGRTLPIADTRKHPEHAGVIVHVPAPGPMRNCSPPSGRARRSRRASTSRGGARTCAFTPPRTCCARWCRIR